MKTTSNLNGSQRAVGNAKWLATGLAAALLASPGTVWAGRDAGLPGEFLNYGVGARPLAMGRAFTAVSDDIDALYWNPAGLSTYRSNQVTFQHSPLQLGGAHQYLAYSQPLYAAGNIGVGVVNMTSGDVDRVDSNNVQIGTFDSRETGYLLSYAYRLKEKLGLGATLKMAEHMLDGTTERGFGADVGALYKWNERVQFGGVLRNALAPSYKYNTDSEKFPTIMRLGGAMNFLDKHLLTSLDLEKAIGNDQGVRWHLGVEGYAIKNIALRLGIDQTEYTGGVGLRWKNMQLDYAAGFQDLGFLNRVSFKAFFGGYEVDVKANPSVFSPVGLKSKTTFHITTSHRQRITKWIMTIRNANNEVVRSFQGFDAPPATLEWDGRDTNGKNVDFGTYVYRLGITDSRGKTENTPIRTLRIAAPTPFEIEAK